MPHPETHLFQVTIEVTGWRLNVAEWVLPAWTPGSYLIREFARHLEGVRAEMLDGSPLPWQRVRKDGWHIETKQVAAFRLRYQVYANELTVRTSHLDSSHGYFNGTNLFMYLDGFKQHPIRLTIEPPEGWHASIALPQNEQGDYLAPTYDLLVDSPAEIGTHRLLLFEALGKAHAIALWGQGNEDEAALLADTQQIVETVAAMFGSELPYERYLFIVHLGHKLGGGLEHANSTTLGADRWTFAPRRDYEKFLRLVAHEFFHTWNGKRIRPSNLGPFDYTKEVYSPLLWVVEGITTYYDILFLARAGLISPRRCLQSYGERIASYLQQPGRLVQSLEESSLTTWIKFYRQDENYINTGISYYLKGSLVAMMLDFALRHHTKNEKSLDDVMRYLWHLYGKRDVGFTVDEFIDALEGVGEAEFEGLLDRFVRDVEELPLERFLALAGLELVSERKSETPTAWAGMLVKATHEGVRVANVLRDSPAEAAGLMAGDRLLALDGYELVDESFLTARLRERAPGDSITFHLFRHGLLMERSLTLTETPPDQVTLRPRPDATPLQQQMLTDWLGCDWPALIDAQD